MINKYQEEDIRRVVRDMMACCCNNTVGLTALSPPVDAPGTDDPIRLFNQSTGVEYYWNGSAWYTLVMANPNDALVKTVEVNLSSAQILSLFTTPVVAIPAVPGKIISVLRTVSSYTFGTIAYTSGANMLLRQSNFSVSSTIMTAADIQGIANEVIRNAGFSPAGTVTLIPEVDTVITSTGAITNGDGTIKMFITYQELSL